MDDLATTTAPTISFLDLHLSAYDLSFLAIECSAFFALLFSVLLMHILCCISAPPERHIMSFTSYLPSLRPTNLETFLFLAIAWIAYLPVSHFVAWLIDLGFLTWIKILIQDPEACFELYSAYEAERWTLVGLINHHTLQLEGSRAVAGAVAYEVFLTWLMFQIVMVLEGIVGVWCDLKEGKESVGGLLGGYRYRLREFVQRVDRAEEWKLSRRKSEESSWVADQKTTCYV